MRENWNRLEKAEKIRLVILALIISWCAYSVIGYTWELYYQERALPVVSGAVVIDGADLTALSGAAGDGLRGFGVLVLYVVYSLAMTVNSAVPFLIYWFAAIRKREAVSAEEAELAKNLVGLGGFLGLVVGIVITRFGTKTMPAWFTVCWIFWAFLFILLPLGRRRGRPSAQTSQESDRRDV